MRKFYSCFTALILVLGFASAFAQRPANFRGTPQIDHSPTRTASHLRTSGTTRSMHQLGASHVSSRSSQLHLAPGVRPPAGGSGSVTAACGPDTVYYPLQKATGFRIININDSVSLGQWYPAPQSLDISGVSFYGFVDSATNATVTLQVRLYNAAPDSTPLGAPIRTATITIDSNFYAGNLGLLEKHVSFSTAATVTGAYVVTVENNNSSLPVGLVINDLAATPPDGLQEWLSCVYLPAPTSGWLNSRGVVLGTTPFDADALIHPHVSYSLTASFSPSPLTGCVGIPMATVNTSSPINLSRFYNRAAFFGIPERSFIWSWGDGSLNDTVIDGVHTYSAPGAYTVTMRDTMFGWSTFCTDSVSVVANIATGSAVTAAFTSSSTGLTASFTDNTTNSPIGWFWDFGDGNTSTTQNPTHTYAANGTYTVCLISGNNCGADTTCQQLLVGPPPPSSCDTIGNITGTPTLFATTAIGYISGHNVFQDSAKAEFFSNASPFSFEEALYWFALLRTPTITTSKVVATVWDATGPAGSPGAVIRTQNLFYNNIDTSGGLTSVTFSPPIVTNNNFYVGIQLENGLGDTVALVNNANGQTIPPTAWEKDSSGTWQRYDGANSWGLDVSHAIWVIQRVAAGFTPATAGLSAVFTDQSEGATAWLWDFGDGNSSTLQNPTHTYAMGGTYTVCQVALNGTCNDTICQTITVSGGCPAPVASFAFTGSPTVSFTNTSTTTGSVVQTGWDFGDGNTSTVTNPTHTYASAGVYTVCMVVVDSCGADTTCQVVNVACIPPVASFTSSSSNLSASFVDGTTNSPTSWAWDFGDGNTSTTQNPSHTYASAGTYLVCLVAQNGCGADSICTAITITCPPPVAAFQDSVVLDTAFFTDLSTGSGLSWIWDFGDGTTGTTQNPFHVYATPGFYTVCLTITDSCGTDSTCTTILVGCPAPTAAFTWIANGLTVDFTDASSTLGSTVTWAWDFGDGNTSTLQNPSHTYATADTFNVCLIVSDSCLSDTICLDVISGCNTAIADFSFTTSGLGAGFVDLTTNTPTNWFWDFGDGNTSTIQSPNHTYAVQGTYIVCLTASNGCGINTYCDTVTIICPPPVANFGFITNNLTVVFADSTTNSPNSWAWDFGDGSAINPAQNPTHTYSAPGTYLACLYVENNCGIDSICKVVTVTCPQPTPAFTFTVSGFTAVFTDGSTGGVTGWLWDFGDGTTSTLQNPTHTYAATGTYSVCLTVTNSCGSQTICQNVIINCPPPASNFTFITNNLLVQFADASGGTPTGWTWDFGDGTTSALQNPAHTYAAPGTYNVCLTVTNACGSNTFCQPVTAVCPLPVALFTSTTSGLTANFTDQTTNGPTSWFWDFGDGNTNNIQNPSHTYTAPGSYTVCLIASNSCGSDTVCFAVGVSCPAPGAGFTFLTVGNNVDFTNATTGSPTSFAWDFGDGSTSTAISPSHSYTATGTYNVCLIASSICGADTFCQSVIISCVPPTAGFSSSVVDSVVSLTNSSSANSLNYNWTFGDGTTSTAVNPTHTYSAPGTYTICLIVDNTCGRDTSCQTVTITCTNPTSGYTVSINNATASFTDVSILPQSWFWDFGDGTTSTAQNPTHSYTQPGTYSVCLTVTNFCGTNTSCQNLIIACNSPAPNFSFVNGVGTTNFTDLSGNTPTRWLWDFGDGTTDTVQNPQHGYLFAGSFWVCLRVWNSCGRADTCMWVSVTTIGIDDELFGNSLSIYPNPSGGTFNIEGEIPTTTDLQLSVSNALGERVWMGVEQNAFGTFRKTLNLDELSKGVYFLEILGDGKRTVRKLIIE